MKRLLVVGIVLFAVISANGLETGIGPMFSIVSQSENDGISSGSYYDMMFGITIPIQWDSGVELTPEIGLILYNENDPNDLVSSGTDFSRLSLMFGLGRFHLLFGNDAIDFKLGVAGKLIIYGRPTGSSIVSYDQYSMMQLTIDVPVALDFKLKSSLRLRITQTIVQMDLQNLDYRYSGIKGDYCSLSFISDAALSPTFSFYWIL